MKSRISYTLMLVLMLSIFIFNSGQAWAALDTSFEVNWSSTFGGAKGDEAFDLIAVEDGYVFTGTFTDEAGLEYTALVKTDQEGNSLWEKKFGGNFHSVGRSLAQTKDGGYIVCGTNKTFMVSNDKVYLIKTDGEGNLQWEQKIDLTAQGYGNTKRQGYSIKEVDGGYMIAGSMLSGDTSDGLIIKTNSLGIVSWARALGGMEWDWFYDIEPVEDGYIAAGFTEKNSKSYEYVVKIGFFGELVWEYSGTTPGSHVKDLIITSDGNIVGTGYRNMEISLIKLGSAGVSYWGYVYDTGIGYGVVELANGDFVIAGNSKILGIKDTGKKSWMRDLTQDSGFVKSVVISDSGTMVFAGYKDVSNNMDAYLFELGVNRASLGISTTNAIEGGTVYLYSPLYLKNGDLDKTGEADVRVKINDGEEEIWMPLKDNDPTAKDDFQLLDGIYSGSYTVQGTDTCTIDLYVDGLKEDAKNIKVITNPNLLVLTDYEKLYQEFLDTGTAVGEDKDDNCMPDFFDLMERIREYAENHNGIAFDISKEITIEKGWSSNYADLSYKDMDAAPMGQSIDAFLNQVSQISRFKNVAIIGDDEVIPFYRKNDPTFDAATNKGFESEYVTDDMKGKDWGNPALRDTSQPFILTDVPYSNYNNLDPDTVDFPIPDAGVGRIFADQPSVLLRMIDGYETPINLIPASSKAVVFSLDSDLPASPDGVDFPICVENTVISVLETKYKKPRAWIAAPYNNGYYYWYEGTLRDWGGDHVVSAVNGADMTCIWSHADHFSENTQGFLDITYTDYKKLNVSPGHLLINAGCHSGFTISHNNELQPGESFLPYDRAMVNQIISKQIAYFAPITYGISSNVKPTDHDLLSKLFLQALLNNGAGTVGERLGSAYWNYRVENGFVSDTNSIYAAYGSVYYGLPTQKTVTTAAELAALQAIALSVQEEVPVLRSLGLMEETALFSATAENRNINVSVAIPEYKKITNEAGKVRFEIPNGGNYSKVSFAPILPMILKTYTLPIGSMVNQVTLESSTNSITGEQVELETLIPINRTKGPVTGTFALSNPYPGEIFTWNQEVRGDGVYLHISITPMQYNPATKLATLYHNLNFKVNYDSSVGATGIAEVVINNGSSVETEISSVPINIKINSALNQTLQLEWQVRDNSGLVIKSGGKAVSLLTGENQQQVSFDTIGWTPGGKDLTILVRGDAVTASHFSELPVSGLNININMAERVFEPSDSNAAFTVEVRDENGSGIPNLTRDKFNGYVDGVLLGAATMVELGEGFYRFEFSVFGLSETIHRLKIDCTDSGGKNASAEEDFLVKADKEPPQVIRTSPAQYEAGVPVNEKIVIDFDELVFPDSAYELIQVVKSHPSGDLTVEISKSIESAKLIITPLGEMDLNSIYKVILPMGGVADKKANELCYPYTFSFITYAEPDTVPPTVISTVPEEGSGDFPVNAAVRIDFSESIGAGVNASDINWTANGGAVSFDVRYYASQLILTPQTAVPYNANCLVTLPAGSINDLSGNLLAADYTLTFTSEAGADTEAPVIIKTLPEDGMIGALVNTLITMQFNETILKGDRFSEILLTDPEGTSLPYTADIQRDTVTLTPEENFELNKEYKVTVPAGVVEDLIGNSFSTNQEFSFTTGDLVDTNSPEVDLLVPADGAEGVLTNARLFIYFDEGIQQGGNFANISVLDMTYGGASESIGVTPTILGRYLMLTPAAELRYASNYQVRVPAGALQDLTGNPLIVAVTFDFQTENSPDTAPPELISTDPLNNAEGVNIDTQIIFTFDELLQAGDEFNLIQVTAGEDAIAFTKAISGKQLILSLSDLSLSTMITPFVPAGALSDLLGNLSNKDYSISFTTTDEINVDLIPPVTTHSAAGTLGVGGWYTSDVEITLNSSDDHSGVAGTSYSLDGTIWTDYSLPFIIDREGETTLFYRTTDKAGNVEAVKNWTVNIDSIPPRVASSVPADGAASVGRNLPITLTFNEEIVGGGAYNDISLKAGENPVQISKEIIGRVLTVTPVATSYGTAYTLTIPVNATTDIAGNSQRTAYIMIFTTVNENDPGGPGRSSGVVPVAEDIVVTGSINETEESIVSTTGERDPGSSLIPVIVDRTLLNEKLLTEKDASVISIAVNSQEGFLFSGLTGQTIKTMELKGAVLEVSTGLASYTIPGELINIDEIAAEFGQGIDLEKILVNVKISAPDLSMVKIIENAAVKGEFTIVVPPVEFFLECSYGDRTIQVDRFRAPVERLIPIPAGINPSKITTGVVIEQDDTVRHVPTKIIEIDGKYYAKITSLTNSVYTLVWHQVEFEDVADHWSKESVNEMGARFIVSGGGTGRFKPGDDITRAELAAIITRALGVKAVGGKDAFFDVAESDWYYGAVSTAKEYGIISGYMDNNFKPMQKVTREESIVMIARAMKLAGVKARDTDAETDITDAEIQQVLEAFQDGKDFSGWSRKDAVYAIKNKLIVGNGGRLLSGNNITRGETATIILRMLRSSGLI